jgi:hypothetical protein
MRIMITKEQIKEILTGHDTWIIIFWRGRL